jgi:hypothetical protein
MQHTLDPFALMRQVNTCRMGNQNEIITAVHTKHFPVL